MTHKQFRDKIIALLNKVDTEDINILREVIVELLMQQLIDENEEYLSIITELRRRKLYAY